MVDLIQVNVKKYEQQLKASFSKIRSNEPMINLNLFTNPNLSLNLYLVSN